MIGDYARWSRIMPMYKGGSEKLLRKKDISL
jgi:hypothetical protein